MDNPRIIGLAGTNGSGKDTIGQMLADNHGLIFISVTDLLRNELTKQGVEVTRENLRDLSARWRRESGHLGVLMDKALEEYKKTEDKFSGVVIGSLRNPGEADRVHELGGQVIWVDADPRLRYERIQANAAARHRGGEDDKTFEQFEAEEAAEMNKPADGDNASLNMSAVKERSDLTINNEGDTSELKEKLVQLGL